MEPRRPGPPPGQTESPPPRRITINDRRKLSPEVSAAGPPGAESPAGGPAPAPEPAASPPAAAGAENPLAAELEAAKAEAASYREDLQRLKAEFDNYRKRIVKEQTSLLERASVNLVHRLLPVLDNFELAVASAEESREFDRMLKGIEMVFGELKEVLGAEGLAPIAAKGRPFDPNVHEAALQVDGDGEGEPYVADELRTGYTYKGMVLRPAMVKVAHRKA